MQDLVGVRRAVGPPLNHKPWFCIDWFRHVAFEPCAHETLSARQDLLAWLGGLSNIFS